MNNIPRSSFSTRNFKSKHRFGAWREDISLIFDVEEPSSENKEPFHATFDLYNFGQSVLAKLHSSSARYVRSRKKALSDGLDSILLQLFIKGEIQFGSGKRTTYANLGDIVVFDLSQPVDNFNSSFLHLTIMLPREVIEAAIPEIHRWHGLALPRDNPSFHLLRNHLISSFELAPSFDMKAAGYVEAATIALAAAAMSGSPPLVEGSRKADVERAMIHQIKRYIQRNLGSTELSPESIAHDFGVSRAQVYRLMEPVGGISSYIRRLRLHRCMADLRDPRFAHQNVSEIAYRLGFEHLTTFNRSFREAFGMTPSEARREHRQPSRSSSAHVGVDTNGEPHQEHRNWIRRFVT